MAVSSAVARADEYVCRSVAFLWVGVSLQWQVTLFFFFTTEYNSDGFYRSWGHLQHPLNHTKAKLLWFSVVLSFFFLTRKLLTPSFSTCVNSRPYSFFQREWIWNNQFVWGTVFGNCFSPNLLFTARVEGEGDNDSICEASSTWAIFKLVCSQGGADMTFMTSLCWKGAVISLHFHDVFVMLSVVAGGFWPFCLWSE